MTLRARVYLTIAAARNLAVAALCLAAPTELEHSAAITPLITAMHLWVWGILFTGAGIFCGYGAVRRTPWVARTGLMLSASSTAMVAVSLIYAIIVIVHSGDSGLPTGMTIGAIVWSALACKDFTVCADPLRSPFEEWAEELINPNEREGGDGRSGSA